MTLPFFSLLERFFFFYFSFFSVRYKVRKKKTFIYLFIEKMLSSFGPGLPAVVCPTQRERERKCVYLRNGDRTEFMTTPIFLAVHFLFF